MRKWLLAALGSLAVCALAPPATASAGANLAVEPDAGRKVLLELLEGNIRFAGGRALRPRAAPHDRAALAHGQAPRAAVVGCADARVPPELLFDQGFGDLFVVRVAGNTIESDVVAGSMAYAVDHLGVPLVMVLGHERCGAVEAAFKGGHVVPAIAPLLRPLAHAVASVPYGAGDQVDAAVDANVQRALERLHTKLRADPHHPVRPVLFVGARYDLDTGLVSLVHILE